MASKTILTAGQDAMVSVRGLLGKTGPSSEAWLDSSDTLLSGSDPKLHWTCSQITVRKSYVRIHLPGRCTEN